VTSVIADAPFEKVTLTYSVRGAESGRDALGNPTHSVSTGMLSALMAPRKGSHLHRQPGVDPKVTSVKGELVTPLTFPPGVGLGSTLTLTWMGQPATLTLTNVIPNDLIGVNFGAYFEGDML